MEKSVMIIGSGGHASVLIDCLKQNNQKICGILTLEEVETWCGVPVLGGDEEISRFSPDEVELVNAVGSVKSTTVRKKIFQSYKSKGYYFANVIHPSAVVSPTSKLNEGVQLMAGAIIQSGTEIGDNTIINTKASIDHDCVIGKNTHVAPGATISGGVVIGENVHIGTAAVIIQGIKIGNNCVVGAGAVVIKDVPDGEVVVGVPAKSIGRNE